MSGTVYFVDKNDGNLKPGLGYEVQQTNTKEQFLSLKGSQFS